MPMERVRTPKFYRCCRGSNRGPLTSEASALTTELPRWGVRFQPVKCNIMQLTRKWIKKISAVYSLEGTVLKNVDNIKYLGETISKDLKWNTRVSNVCTKANRIGFLRRNLSSCPQDVKETACKGLVRPILDYASPIWYPHGIVVQEELEKVQNRAARLVTGNYNCKYDKHSWTVRVGVFSQETQR